MKEVRIGFFGTGNMGQMAHLKNYVDLPGCDVVALAEPRPALARQVARRYGVDKVYADGEEMLAQEQLDGVVCSQPFRIHAGMLPKIYPHVKHVLTEKPLAVWPDAGQALADAAAEHGCVHMVGYHKRSDPATVHAKELIDEWKGSGELGKLKYVRILMPGGDWQAGGYVGKLSSDEPYPEAVIEPRPDGVSEEAAHAHELFVNFYIHQVNLLRHLLGESYEVTYAEPTGVLLAVRAASGVAGVIEMSPYSTTVLWEESVLIGFEKGYINLRLPAPLTCNRAGTVEIYRDPGDGATPERMEPTLPWVHAMRQQAMNFVAVCAGQMAPPCTAAEAAEDLRVARDYIRLRYGQ